MPGILQQPGRGKGGTTFVLHLIPLSRAEPLGQWANAPRGYLAGAGFGTTLGPGAGLAAAALAGVEVEPVAQAKAVRPLSPAPLPAPFAKAPPSPSPVRAEAKPSGPIHQPAPPILAPIRRGTVVNRSRSLSAPPVPTAVKPDPRPSLIPPGTPRLNLPQSPLLGQIGSQIDQVGLAQYRAVRRVEQGLTSMRVNRAATAPLATPEVAVIVGLQIAIKILKVVNEGISAAGQARIGTLSDYLRRRSKEITSAALGPSLLAAIVQNAKTSRTLLGALTNEPSRAEVNAQLDAQAAAQAELAIESAQARAGLSGVLQRAGQPGLPGTTAGGNVGPLQKSQSGTAPSSGGGGFFGSTTTLPATQKKNLGGVPPAKLGGSSGASDPTDTVVGPENIGKLGGATLVNRSRDAHFPDI